MKRTNLMLLAVVVILVAQPLLLPIPNQLGEPFPGADDQGKKAIVASNPDYRPWFKPIWEPPSGEITNLFFALQGALGAGLLGYYLGLRRGRAQRRNQDNVDAGH
ncbi:MAG TPA: energy-coupling factor ABC transporter substrate-binding protein [Candidatus Competibacter sp.]|mgnify:FL=1|jgi:cobalt/nickel transport protein|nr:energy-coupling factor ABC transporter substrate-binding protein [Candidatus Competibacter sp.]HRF61427.1 energy-coupling factor ABC transporter substrate-binding protein [Candidatus Competibacter sp.]HRX59628.1 energy-coupling factor ABC transporter substrate-binding protein [Candidatus Competibacter sp.]